METGDLRPRRRAVPTPPRSCKAAATLLSLTAQNAGVRLVRNVAPDLPELVADRRACRQILINLISNALSSRRGTAEVRVGATRDRERIVLTVSDTGIGVTEADLPRLGDPFFQAGRRRGRPDDGTGLGLSVVRGLVALHRGS
jgi:cell cycle sensor histidine kinase DivJ